MELTTYRLAKKPNIDDRKPKIDFSLTNIDVNTSSYFAMSGFSDIFAVFLPKPDFLYNKKYSVIFSAVSYLFIENE